VEQKAHSPEIDLRLLAGRRIVDPNRGRLLAPPELLLRVAPERVVAPAQTVITNEQGVDFREPQRTRLVVAGQLTLDAGAVLRHIGYGCTSPVLPSRGRRVQSLAA
jgi:hypothetical protein